MNLHLRRVYDTHAAFDANPTVKDQSGVSQPDHWQAAEESNPADVRVWSPDRLPRARPILNQSLPLSPFLLVHLLNSLAYCACVRFLFFFSPSAIFEDVRDRHPPFSHCSDRDAFVPWPRMPRMSPSHCHFSCLSSSSWRLPLSSVSYDACCALPFLMFLTVPLFFLSGAGNRNRTDVTRVETSRFTTKLYPHLILP